MPLSRFASVLVVCCALPFCCAQEQSKQSVRVTVPPTDSRPDDGSVEGNTYKNAFFGLTYRFPKGWIPHGDATKQRLMELGKDKVVSSGGASRETADVSEKHTYNLLTVFENELGTPGVQYFRSEILLAEDVSFAPGIKTGKDYLLNTLPLLKKAGYEEFSEIEALELGGRAFYRANVKKQVRQDLTVYQSYIVGIVKGHALAVVITTEDKSATDQLVAGLSLGFGLSAESPNTAGVTTEAPRPVPTGQDPQESGSFRSGVYRNTYFGITYHLPEGWYADTGIFKRQLQENTGTASDPSKRTFVLLSANRYPPGTQGLPSNPTVVIMADEAAPYRTIHTGKDYLPKVTRGLMQNEHAELIQQGHEDNFGGQQFYRADYKRPEIGYQAVLCTLWKGYVLSWVFVGGSPSQVDEMVLSMRSISYDQVNVLKP